MKCPVCFTNVAFNEERCPNCGMIIKSDKKSTQYAQPIINQVHHKTSHYQKEINDFLKQTKQMKLLFGGWNMIIVVLMILFIIRLFIGFGIDFIDYSKTYYSLNDAMEEVVDDGTLAEVVDIKNNIQNGLIYYYNVGYDEEIEVNDSIDVDVNYIGQYDHCGVSVCIEATDAQITSYTIQFDGYYSGNLTWNKIPVKDEMITYMMDELGYMDAYEDYQEIRKEAIVNNYDYYYEKEFEDYSLVFSEYYEEDCDETIYQIIYIIK